METITVEFAKATELTHALSDLSKRMYKTQKLARTLQNGDHDIAFPSFMRMRRVKVADETKEQQQINPQRLSEEEERIKKLDNIQLYQDTQELEGIAQQVIDQINQGSIEKDLLLRLNKKLGTVQANYGHIAAITVTLAAVISGIKDLIELFQLMN